MIQHIKNKFLKPHADHHMQEVLKGASSALAIRIFGVLLGFTVSVVIARLLGAEGSGIYYLALSVTTIAASVGRFGFDNTVVRFIASHASIGEWGDVRYVYRIVMRIVVLTSLFISVVLFLGAEWVANSVFDKPFMEIPLRLTSIAVLPLALAIIQADSLRGLKRISASEWVKAVLVSLVTLVLLYPFIEMWNVNGTIAAYVAGVLLTFIVAWILWSKSLGRMARADSSISYSLSIQHLFQSSWPLFGVALTSLVIQQAGTIFLGIWGTVEDVGIFNVANRIASLLLFPLVAMISILAPKFAAMHKQGDMDGLKKLARNSSRMLTLFVVPAVVVMSMVSEYIMALFGTEFINGATVLMILLVGVVVNVATGAVSEILMMSGFEKDCRNVNLSGAVLIIVLCAVLIPMAGVVGTAISVTIGIAGKNLLMVYMVYKRLGFWPISIYFKVNT